MLRRGNYDRALKLANDGLYLASSKDEQSKAQEILAEIHFRAAMTSPQSEQVARLEKALALRAKDPRIRFRYAIALWRVNRLPEALKELEKAYKENPKQHQLSYLLQLARVSQGKSWRTSDMTARCANTLHTVQRFLHGVHNLPLPEPRLSSHPEMWQSLADMVTEYDNPSEILKEAAESSDYNEVKQILYYYEGVAALRNDEKEKARQAWLSAKKTGFDAPWLNNNLSLRLRQRAIELAAEERWEAITNLTKQGRNQLDDRILSETIGLAYFHLGHQQAQSNNWPRAAHFWRQASKWAGNRHIAQNLALAEEALENWGKAAEAWRDMVRRRPRSENHPDYLDDNQISGIWRHAAECYRHIDDITERINCLRKALKHAEEDTELLLELADELYRNDQEDSAQKELNRILEIDTNHVDALMRLANLNKRRPKQAISLWRRVLAIQSDHQDAREGLTEVYITRLSDVSPWELDSLVAQALEDLPDNARILVSIAIKYQHIERFDEAIDLFQRGYLASPEDTRTVGLALHELIYLEASLEFTEKMMQEVSEISNLLPSFWLNQASLGLKYELELHWVKRFLEEAIVMAERDYVDDSKATLLMTAYELLERRAPDHLCEYFAQRIRSEVPNSGGLELIKALTQVANEDRRAAKRLFGRAKRRARRMKDKSALEFIEETERINLSMPSELSSDLIMRLMELFPDGPPSIDALEDLLNDL